MDLTGIKFHDLIVVSKHASKGHNSKWVCRCLLCGSETVVTRPNLRSGNTKDCGCRKLEKLREANLSHGDSHAFGTRGHEIYKKWLQMKARVRDPNKPYLRKGISVCEDWLDYEVFKSWADSEHFDPALELDRIDNNRGYSPDNCRWVTHAENCRNKTHPYAKVVMNSKGEIFPSRKAASEAYGLHKDAVSNALKKGYLCAGLSWKPV